MKNAMRLKWFKVENGLIKRKVANPVDSDKEWL